VAQVRTDARAWLHQRCCPRCGYCGWELQQTGERSPYECPNCDEDLYARRPLSYAEREGLVGCPNVPGIEASAAPQTPSLTIRLLRGLKAVARRVFRG
jgi:predicted RNA-binding Zn-ribbon protein involved in translation (DUF1610 family)